MSRPTPEQLRTILDAHSRWLRGEMGGERADLSGVDLGGADLGGADLSVANLAGADLVRADLSVANLVGANLVGADLAVANLTGANLIRADLRGASLAGANLGGANLGGASLGGANLGGANLGGASLARASLARADLTGADLRETILDPAAAVPPLPAEELLQAAGLTLRTVRGRRRVYGRRTRRSVYFGDTEYTRRWHHAPVLSVDQATACHPGIYLGGTEIAGRGDLVDAWAYADEAVYVNTRKGARARRIYVLGEVGGE